MNYPLRLVNHSFVRTLAALLLIAANAPAVEAQNTESGGVAATVSAAVSAAVQRARVMVDAGEGTKARELLDSVVKAVPRESNDAAEALYWRALLSEESAPAELDWKRIVVESPFSPRASEALLRLAELNQTRNNQQGVRQNVQQLLFDHPDAPERSRALLVLARSYFDTRDAPRACGVLTAVRKEAPLGAVEVRLQADEMQQQCRNVREVALGAELDAPTSMAPVSPAPPTGAAASGTLAGQTAGLPPATSARPPANAAATQDNIRRAAADDATRLETARKDSIARAGRSDAIARVASARRDSVARAAHNDSIARVALASRDSLARVSIVRNDSVARAAMARNDSIVRVANARSDSIRAVIARDNVLRDSLRRVYAARDSAAGTPTARDRARRDSATRIANTVDSLAAAMRGAPPTNARPPATNTSANAGRFTVQIAAFKTRAQANTLARKLNGAKLNAFVAGSKQPFRVNVGRYATRAEATETLAALRKKGQKGFVTEVPPA